MVNPLQDALAQFQDPSWIWQLTLILSTLALAWLLTWLLGRRFTHKPETAAKFLDLAQVLWPVFTLLLLLLNMKILQHWMETGLFRLAIALALSWLLIRALHHVLRMAFAPSDLLKLVQQTLTAVILLALVLHATGLGQEVTDTLDEIALTIGKQRISILLILEGALSILLTVAIVLWIGRIIEDRVMRAETLEMNLRIVLSKIVRSFLLLFGILIALPLVGIDITFLSVFGGALGVGLGFGLQKVASNYISGFIILLDRSIRIGDLVAVDNRYGEVEKITNRYTVVKNRDGTEAIVPNETMITSTVINHSYSNRNIRMNLTVGISYDSSLERAMQILHEVALATPRVLHTPHPEVYLKEFGDNGILLELSVWLSDPEEGQLSLRSALNLAIWRQFKAEGIEFPYPHRDVRILDSTGITVKSTHPEAKS